MALKVKAKEQLFKIGMYADTYRYVMIPELYIPLTQEKVIKEAALRSGVSRGVMQACWDAAGEVIKAWATEGHSVALPGLGTMRFSLRILDGAGVARSHPLHLLTVAVDTGDLDRGVLQLVLQIHTRGEDDAAGLDEAGLYILHLLHSLRTESESHGAESGQSHRVTLRSPGLDHLTGCIPAGLHHAAAHTASEGSLLDDLCLREAGVEVGFQHIAINARIILVVCKLQQSFYCLYFHRKTLILNVVAKMVQNECKKLAFC